jgi:hypothetical protein
MDGWMDGWMDNGWMDLCVYHESHERMYMYDTDTTTSSVFCVRVNYILKVHYGGCVCVHTYPLAASDPDPTHHCESISHVFNTCTDHVHSWFRCSV